MASLSQEWRVTHHAYKFKKVDRNGNVRSVRHRNRCPLCGRSRAFYRRFRMCRLCLRDHARKGHIPGLIKASW